MPTILGLDIDPKTVRGVVARTTLRKSALVQYIEVPIDEEEPSAAEDSASRVQSEDASTEEKLTPDGHPPGDPLEGGAREPLALPESIAVPQASSTSDPLAADAPASAPLTVEVQAHDVDPVRRAVQRLLAQLEQPPDKVFTELSGDAVSIRSVSLPAKAARRLEELLPFELEAQIPFEPTESIIAHQTLESNPNEVSLMAAVAPKERVRDHLDAMKAVGIQPREIGVGAVALQGLVPLVPELGGEGARCVIDIHHEGTDVCILRDGVCRAARTLSVRIDDLDSGQHGLLSRELRQTLARWRMDGGEPITAFFVGGEFARREGTAQWLSPMVNGPVDVVSLPEAPGADAADRPAFCRAAALAGRALSPLKQIDMRKGEFESAQTMNVVLQHAGLIGLCAAVIIGAFLFANLARYRVLATQNNQLREQLADVTDQELGRRTTSPSQATQILNRGIRGNDPAPKFDAWDALVAISESVDGEIAHDVSQLQIDLGDGAENGRFSLSGSVGDLGESERIQTALANYRFVRRVGDMETSYACFHDINERQNNSIGERRNYRIEGSIRCESGESGDEEEGDEE